MDNSMLIENEDLQEKIVLEVGSGRGDTTRKLIKILSKKQGLKLIVSDISDSNFQELQDEFSSISLQIQYLCSSAQDLSGIELNSVDFIVCNYTLCAVNSQPCAALLALRRFYEVLKPYGKLFIEEEYPLFHTTSFPFKLWSEKWMLIKSLLILSGNNPFNEIAPEILGQLCNLIGFTNMFCSNHTCFLPSSEVTGFFQNRLEVLIKYLSNENLKTGYLESAQKWQNKIQKDEGMEVPYYRLSVQKI